VLCSVRGDPDDTFINHAITKIADTNVSGTISISRDPSQASPVYDGIAKAVALSSGSYAITDISRKPRFEGVSVQFAHGDIQNSGMSVQRRW